MCNSEPGELPKTTVPSTSGSISEKLEKCKRCVLKNVGPSTDSNGENLGTTLEDLLRQL